MHTTQTEFRKFNCKQCKINSLLYIRFFFSLVRFVGSFFPPLRTLFALNVRLNCAYQTVVSMRATVCVVVLYGNLLDFCFRMCTTVFKCQIYNTTESRYQLQLSMYWKISLPRQICALLAKRCRARRWAPLSFGFECVILPITSFALDKMHRNVEMKICRQQMKHNGYLSKSNGIHEPNEWLLQKQYTISIRTY